jgi:acetyl-CoA acetyltransferase family protein
MAEIHVLDAIRTPRGKGKPDGSLAGIPPWDLVGQLVDALRARGASAALEATDRLALGCVTQSGPQGGHLALLSRIHAGLPDTAVAVTLNNYCVSGMSALAAAARAIATGENSLALAGGVESMSQAPFESDGASFYRDAALAAHFRYLSPPLVADWLATREGITRAELDEVTVASHRRAGQAWQDGHYATSVVPVTRPDGARIERDELVRAGLAVADLGRFPAAFAALGAQGAEALVDATEPGLGGLRYLHAVPHCPPIADGAALLLIGTRERAAEFGLRPRARLAAAVEVNTDPLDPFAAGFAALERILAGHRLALEDIGAIEFMEAFAAVPATFRRRYPQVAERANASGGHLAMGHPMGASGAILVATLLAEMERKDVEWGVAVAHAVSGVGAAVLLQRT